MKKENLSNLSKEFNLEKSEEKQAFTFVSISPMGIISNSLRKVLIEFIGKTSIVGISFFQKDEFVKTEYSSLSGVLESIHEIISNLKKIVFKEKEEKDKVLNQEFDFSNDTEEEMLIYGSSLNSDFEVLNKDQFIMTLSPGCSLKLTLYFFHFFGFRDKDKNQELFKDYENKRDIIILESSHSPVKKVAIALSDFVDNYLQRSQSVTLTITTDSSISPSKALEYSKKKLLELTETFLNSSEIVSSEEDDTEE